MRLLKLWKYKGLEKIHSLVQHQRADMEISIPLNLISLFFCIMVIPIFAATIIAPPGGSNLTVHYFHLACTEVFALFDKEHLIIKHTK